MPPISAPLPEPPTARPINAPAAAPPATAPTFRPRVEPATMLSAVALMLCDLPFASIEVTRSTSTARSPFSAGFTPSTTPCTTLPAGNGAMLPTTTASEIEPDHSWPMLAVSEESGEFIVILSPVPAVTVAVGAAGGAGGVRFGLGCSGFGGGVGEGGGGGVGGAGGGGRGLRPDVRLRLALPLRLLDGARGEQAVRAGRRGGRVLGGLLAAAGEDDEREGGEGGRRSKAERNGGAPCGPGKPAGGGSHRMPAGRGRRKRRARSAGPGACARRSLAESFARAVKIVSGATRRPKLLRRHRRAAGPLRRGAGRRAPRRSRRPRRIYLRTGTTRPLALALNVAVVPSGAFPTNVIVASSAAPAATAGFRWASWSRRIGGPAASPVSAGQTISSTLPAAS